MNHVDRPASHVDAAPAHLDLQPQRFSLDVQRAFETVECRQRRDMDHSANQWFYDEFSGMYRHKAPRKGQQRLERPPSPSWPQTAAAWPVPETAEQIYAWRDEARRQPHRMLRLACHLMDVQLAELRQIAATEAYRLLKRLTQYRGPLNGDAHYALGNYHGFGYFNGRNADQAYIMYIQASKQNHAEATYRTAVCLERGMGTHHDPSRAFVFYRKAAHLGHPASMYKLGIVLLKGQLDQSVHKREAIHWLQRAIETNAVPLAQHTLAMIQLNHHDKNDDTGLIIEDYPYAIGLLYDAAQLGYCRSQVKLGECFEYGRFVHQDMDLALYWYAKAAASGSAEAAIALSGIYFTGLGALGQSDREAYLWARKAVTLASAQYRQHGVERWTLAKACFMVGYYIEEGIGTDLADALKWYKRAALLGHACASKRLAKENASATIATSRCVVM